MEINKTKQAVSVSKVEEDQRADVTKAKPIGTSQTPDSFEIGSSRTSSNESSDSTSAEPEKKAGQITGGILIKQITAARLGQPSATRESTRQTEVDGKKDLGTDERTRANGTNSGLEPRSDNRDDLVGNQTGNTGTADTGDQRTKRTERGAQLENFFANHGFDTSSGGGSSSDGASPSSGGGGGMSSGANSGGSSTSPSGASDAINNAFNGGPTGPGNPMDSINERQARRNALENLNSAGSLRSAMMDKLNPESGDQASTGPSKEMISSPGDDYVAGIAEGAGGVAGGAGAVAVGYQLGQLPVLTAAASGGATAAVAVAGVAGAFGAGLVVGHGLGILLDKFVEGVTGGDETSLGAAAASSGEDARINQQLKEQKIASEKAIAEQKAKNAGTAGTAGTAGSSGTSSSSGTSGTSSTSSSSGTSSTAGTSGTSTNYENYVDPKAKKLKQMSNALSELLGVDTTAHKPRIAGDKDPDPNATPESQDISGIAVVSKEYLIGQPNQENQAGGPSTNGWGDDPILGGGAIDYEDRSGYHGGTRTEDPGEMNTAPGGSALKPAATDTTEEEDNDKEENTNSSTKTTR